MCVERACGDPRSPVHGRGSDLCDGSRQVWTVVVAMADDSLTHWAAREPHQTRTDAETVAVRRSSDLDRGRATGTKKRNTWSENAEPRLSRAAHHTTVMLDEPQHVGYPQARTSVNQSLSLTVSDVCRESADERFEATSRVAEVGLEV